MVEFHDQHWRGTASPDPPKQYFDVTQCDEADLSDIWHDRDQFQEDLQWIASATPLRCPRQHNPSTIVVFDEYEKLLPRLVALHAGVTTPEGAKIDAPEQLVSGVSVKGGPGIGKTCSQVYLLMKQLQSKQPAIWVRSGLATLFVEEGVYEHLCNQSEAERDFWDYNDALEDTPSAADPYVPGRIWVFLDAEGEGQSRPPDLFISYPGFHRWFVIYTTSPRQALWMRKRPYSLHIMEPPAWKEIVAA